MITFFDKAGTKLLERFAAAEDFPSLLLKVLIMPGFRVEGYTGDFLAVYQVIRSWHGDWSYDLQTTSDGRFILTSHGKL